MGDFILEFHSFLPLFFHIIVEPRNDSSKTIGLMRNFSNPMRFPRIENELRLSFFQLLEAHVKLESLRKGAAVIFHTLDDENGSCAVLDVDVFSASGFVRPKMP